MVKRVGGSYKGPKPTVGLGSGSRARSLAGAFRPKRAANPFAKAKRFETLVAGFKKRRTY